MIGGDVLVFPKNDDPEVIEAQKELAALVISPEAQVGFNDKKGSLPVRSDIDMSKLDACARKGIETLYDPERQLPGYNFVFSPNLGGAVQDTISAYWNDPGMDADGFIEAIATTISTTPDE